MFDFYKTYQANTKLAQDVATDVVAASTAFAKTLYDVNTCLAQTAQTQFAEAYKSMETYKFPGFEGTAKASKKTAE